MLIPLIQTYSNIQTISMKFLIYEKSYHTIFEDQSFQTVSSRDWTVC